MTANENVRVHREGVQLSMHVARWMTPAFGHGLEKGFRSDGQDDRREYEPQDHRRRTGAAVVNFLHMESSQLGEQTQSLDADQKNMAETDPPLPDFYRVDLIWWHTPERLAFEQQEAGLVFRVELIRCREDQSAARLQDAGELPKGPDLVPDMLDPFLAEDNVDTVGRDREPGLKIGFLALQAVGLEGFGNEIVGTNVCAQVLQQSAGPPRACRDIDHRLALQVLR